MPDKLTPRSWPDAPDKTSSRLTRYFLFFIILGILCFSGPQRSYSEELHPALPEDYGLGHGDPSNPRYTLVDYFTADTLAEGELKMGFDLDYGTTGYFMVGTDLLALTVGVPTLQFKSVAWRSASHRLAVGLTLHYFDKHTVFWGSNANKFTKLEGRYFRPSISWTNELSDRLNLHTFWAVGIGRTRYTLSETGKRALWESKNPNENWEARDRSQPPSEEASELPASSLTNKAVQMQSLTGIQKDTFQITGEYKRDGGKKVLITTRVQNSEVEDLKINTIRMTVGQQWIFNVFQFRIGIGFDYQVLSGLDLDGERIEDSGVLPATDLDFYWRF